MRIYGSGLIPSHGDAANALGSKCDRRPFDLGAVLEQRFEADEPAKQAPKVDFGTRPREDA